VKPPSTIDVGLADGTGDDAYLDALDHVLPRALETVPDLVWYVAGADPVRARPAGRPRADSGRPARARPAAVRGGAPRAGVPVAVTLAGGYAERTADTVSIHAADRRGGRGRVLRAETA
jgi:acetoin utilization deacetylase AcuC-like enzyme